ncbi:DUF883 C-terminal domain-containing protein [Sulfitobacter sp. S223]|uniref:DUF883 family protein n=1 Tax=Sulfitobacter sp. S223 TaxID=2867023 RepID=UPI0021A281F4|nr:DUF883 C-terminal domain-containing protein [Sulfitobacter sp. S223]UWR26643.1 DUF883 C-terminal domain-containing protein [Sulfitobacter sp. S223]
MAKANLSLTGNDVSVEDLSAQITTLKNDLATLTQTMADLGAAKTNEAKKAAAKTAEDLHSAGRDKILEAQLQAEDFVQKQPATSLGLAAGLGFLVGILTARR